MKQSQKYFAHPNRLCGFLCLFLALISLDQSAAETMPRKRMALVIGNSKYEAALGPLKNPGNDAKAVAVALRGLGFSVIEKRDLDRDEMLQAVDSFRKVISGSEIALFFYAGHGVAVGGSNYLVPLKSGFIMDAQDSETLKLAAETRLFNAEQLVGDMSSARAKCNLIILDACRSALLANSARTRGGSQSGQFVGMTPPSGSLIAFSTDSGRVAFDGIGKNGLYTEELLKYLTSPGLTIEQVFKKTRAGVMEKSAGNQMPAEYSRLIGEDVFLAGKETPPSQATETTLEAPPSGPILQNPDYPSDALSENLSIPDLPKEKRIELLNEALDNIKNILKDADTPSPAVVEVEKLCGIVLENLKKCFSQKTPRYRLMASKALSRRGDAKLLLGRANEAVKDFEDALLESPNDAYIYFNRGVAHLALGNTSAARSDFLAASNPKLNQPNAKALALEALSKMDERSKAVEPLTQL